MVFKQTKKEMFNGTRDPPTLTAKVMKIYPLFLEHFPYVLGQFHEVAFRETPEKKKFFLSLTPK